MENKRNQKVIEHNLKVPSYEQNKEKEFPKEILICNICEKEKKGIQTGLCNHCGRFGKTNNELALKWWNNLRHEIRQILCNRHIAFAEIHNRHENTLTGKEIEKIWRKELKIGEKDVLDSINEQENEFKPNQKQFKEFNPELFKAYIDKFSDEDLEKAYRIMGVKISIRNSQK